MVSAQPADRRPVRQRRRKTLVMWSAGLDSTYGLIRLLSETGDEVFAHHIHRHARHDEGTRPADTCRYEAEAIERMRPWIEANYRPFAYSESVVDLTAFSSFARDTATAMFFAAQATRMHGFSPADRILLSMNSDEDASWNPGSELYWYLRQVTIRLLKLVWRSEDVPECFLWDPPPTKQAEIDFLPMELTDMTASCRDPKHVNEDETEKGWRHCGICAECQTLSGVTYKPESVRAATQSWAEEKSGG